ncbi:MAG: DNA polymerase I [Minisyncoccia bacterium]
MKTFVIIDSYALAHRAYHALPPLTSPGGVLVNGVYGFMLVFLKMLQELKPDYLVAAFDLAQPTFRHQEYKEYKAQRVKAPENFYEQIQIIKDILTIWEIPILAKEGFEADDIIGTLTQKFQSPDLKFIILTGDLDALQLINKQVNVYTLHKGLQDNIIYDEEAIQKRYGLTPSQLIDFKALKGDPSDNVMGVPGIGEKTALKLIQEFHSLEHLYSVLENQTPEITKLNARLREKLKEHKEEAFFSQHLVTIKKDIDLDFQLEQAEYHEPPQEELVSFLEKLGFQSLIKRIFVSKLENSPLEKSIKVKTIEDSRQLALLFQKIKEADKLSLFLDSNGKKYGERQVFGLYFILPFEEIWYLPQSFFSFLKERQSFLQNKIIFTLGAKELLEEIPEFSSFSFEDLAILAWLIDPDRKNYSLESLMKFFLKKEDFASPLDYLKEFLTLGETIKIKATSLGLDNIWKTIERPLIPILSQMEKDGIFVNKDTLSQLLEGVDKESTQLEKQIYQLARKNFNINSSQQLAEILFQDLKIDSSSLKKTSSGKLSTDIFELTKIQDSHPIIPLIISYRQLEKLKTSFLNPLPKFINPHTKRVHTIWKQTGTATGRLSSEEPNLQNIPVRSEWGKKIRLAFEAEKGFSFISLDYSQIELRLASHLSLDPKMIEAFKQDKDIHTITASYVNNIPEDKVTPEMRQLAKVLNFGIIYGMGDKLLSETAGISLREAKKFKEEYFHDFIGLKNYLVSTIEKAKNNGYVETLFGRKRFLPLIGSLGQIGRQEERIAVNMPIQGLAADLIKLSMIKIQDFLHQENLEQKARIVLQIHDELIIEAKSEIIELIAPKLKDIMEHIVTLEVPLKVKMTFGQRWGEME